ncbi:unnamed protein product [marine sediment metagenome]|uniref:Uncharacterized protein n=1 Tax=marine sediment metagenome TaxID=412755 RepID=X1QJS8_9ZZZZ
METRHIKFDYEDALNAKKQILSTELNLLRTEKKVKTYKLFRKKEIAVKNKLKTALKNLKTKINQIEKTFPEDKQKPITSKKREQDIKKKKKQDIKQELEEIQSKLERLK